MLRTAAVDHRERSGGSRLGWLREEVRRLGVSGSPQRLITALTGREHLWWDCCREAASGSPEWFDEPQTRLIRDWTVSSAADDGDGSALRFYLDSVFQVAHAASGPQRPDVQGTDLEHIARRWQATGMPVPQDEQSGQAMVTLTHLMLTGAHPRRRVVTMPVVFGLADKHGEIRDGVAGLLELQDLPGGPAGLFPDPRVKTPTRGGAVAFARSLEHAWRAAPGRSRGRCVIWRVLLPDAPASVPPLDGGSLGAAFAVGLQELYRYPAMVNESLGWGLRRFYGLRPRTAITGVVDADQRLHYVTGMSAKLSAAHQKNWLLIAPTANMRDIVQAPDPAQVRFASTIRQADRQASRWRVGRLITAAALAFISAVTGSVATNQVSAGAARRQAALQASQSLGSYVVSDMNSTAFAPAALVTDALLAVDAYRTAPTPQAIQALFDSYAALSPFQAVIGAYSPSSAAQDWPVTSSGATQSVSSSITSSSEMSVNTSGTIALVLDASGSVEIWGLPHDLSRRHLIGVLNGVTNAVISPTGTLVAALGSDGIVRVWTTDPFRLRESTVLPAAANGVSIAPFLAIDDDSRYLAIGGGLSPYIWNLSSRRLAGMPVPARADQAVTSAGFLGEGIVYQVQQDGTKYFWNLVTGRQVASPASSSVPVLDSPDITARCVRKAWRFSYILAGAPVAGMPTRLACSAADTPGALNGHFFAVVGSADADAFQPEPYAPQVATIFDVRTGQEVAQAGLAQDTAIAGIDPTGRRLFIQGTPNGIARLSPSPAPGPPTAGPLAPVAGTAVANSPDGQFTAESGYPGTVPGPQVKIISTKNGYLLRTLTMPMGQYPPDSLGGDYIASLTFLPDGRLLVLAAGVLTLWNVTLGTMVTRPMELPLPGNPTPNELAPAPTIAVDPGAPGSVAISALDGKSVAIWDVMGWHRIRTLGPFRYLVNSYGFSPDRSLIAVTLSNASTEILSSTSGSEIGVIPDTPDGLSLLTSGYAAAMDDGGIRLWHGDTQVMRLTAPSGTTLTAAADSSHSALSVTVGQAPGGHGSSLAEPFDLPPDPSSWAASLCTVIGRTLTSQELSVPGPDTPDNGC